METEKPVKLLEKNIGQEEEEEEEKKEKSPLKIILAIFLVLLLIVLAMPYYNIRTNPSPDMKKIPSLQEVLSLSNITLEENVTHRINNIEEFALFIKADDPIIRNIATKIVTESCVQSEICYAKALYYFVRDNIKYVSDPKRFEYAETPREILLTGGGDCDSHSILLASLNEAIGITTRLVFVPSHVYVQIYLPEARKGYKTEGDMISLDTTCKNCEFGELSPFMKKEPRRYLP